MPDKKRKRGRRGSGGGGVDDLSPKELAREYGFGWRFFKQDDELWDLLQAATKNNWSPERFAAKFKATKWYKKHGDVYRQNIGLKFTDPATYRERKQNMMTKVANLGAQWGARLTDREIRKYGTRAYLLGWDDGQILDMIANEVRPDRAGHYKGELSGIEQQLREVAYRNGVNLGRKQTTHWMREIVRGNADSRQFETYIRDIAAKTFGAYCQEIKGGMDAIDVAAPYIQSMADILELNPNSIGVTDRTIRKALSHRNDKGEFVPLSIADFEDNLRSDKRWQYTDQAHEQMRGYAVELGRRWGILS